MKLVILICLFSFTIFAQGVDQKTIIAVLPIDAQKVIQSSLADQKAAEGDTSNMNVFPSESAIRNFSDIATQKVVNTALKMKRLTLVERSAMDKLIQEQNFQLSDFTSENPDVKLGQMLGAEYLILGQLQQLTVKRIIQTPEQEATWGKRELTSIAEFGLRMISISTGEVVASKTFKGDTGFFTYATVNEAISNALDLTNDPLKNWFNSAFPVEGKLIEIQKEKKEEAVEVAISCGSQLGVKKGDKFKVMVMSEIELDGKKVQRSKDIGSLEVTKLESDGIFSKCKVTKGGKDIYAKTKEGILLFVRRK